MIVKIPQQVVYLVILILAIGVVVKLDKQFSSSTKVSKPVPANSKLNTAVAPTVREISVTASQFQFSPNPIRVQLGETVRLRVTSSDVTHGLSIPDLGIDQVIPAGQATTIEFQATRRGSFPFACSVACGVGHANMRGLLIVE